MADKISVRVEAGLGGGLLLLLLMLSSTARADSARAECGFADGADAIPAVTVPCSFSQRQGYIYIDINGGEIVELSPAGDAPGNFQDEQGRSVYRRSGLGDRGQLFQLPDRFLFVYWVREQWSCDAAQLTGVEGCQLVYGDIVFTVHASEEGSLNELVVLIAGANIDLQSEQHEIDGTAYRAEAADLDGNGWPELYVAISSAGSGSYGSLVAYAVNNGLSATPVYLRPLSEDREASAGYRGHDEFAVMENRLAQRFPIYRESDTNSRPTGGTRQILYRLVPGEAGWLLEKDGIEEY